MMVEPVSGFKTKDDLFFRQYEHAVLHETRTALNAAVKDSLHFSAMSCMTVDNFISLVTDVGEEVYRYLSAVSNAANIATETCQQIEAEDTVELEEMTKGQENAASDIELHEIETEDATTPNRSRSRRLSTRGTGSESEDTHF